MKRKMYTLYFSLLSMLLLFFVYSWFEVGKVVTRQVKHPPAVSVVVSRIGEDAIDVVLTRNVFGETRLTRQSGVGAGGATGKNMKNGPVAPISLILVAVAVDAAGRMIAVIRAEQVGKRPLVASYIVGRDLPGGGKIADMDVDGVEIEQGGQRRWMLLFKPDEKVTE